MGRRSFISMTAIKKIVSASNRIKRERYKNELIRAQDGNGKERPPQFSLTNVDFNITSRIARIEILQSQEYRTIQKYITQNYVKYPIYSEWKIKEKTLKKTLKLTNSELELLNVNEDNLIKMFAEEIIIELNNEELFPSWFIKMYLKRELDSDLQNMKNELNFFIKNQNNKIITQQTNIDNYNNEITTYSKTLNRQQKKQNKLELKLTKLSNTKPSILKSLISLGIFNYLISNKRKNKLELKLSTCNSFIGELNRNISDNNYQVIKCNKNIDNYKLNITDKEKEYKNKRELRLIDYNKKILEVKPLSNMVSYDDTFTMLKLFSGIEYEKIIGVYVIHNKEKDKYYVGQSKDVMKRIKQHFNGTIPKNTIFAEDYYTSQMEDRDNIFELKIIRCETKDELDRLERKLIYEYDSWNNGYNGTSGNI